MLYMFYMTNEVLESYFYLHFLFLLQRDEHLEISKKSKVARRSLSKQELIAALRPRVSLWGVVFLVVDARRGGDGTCAGCL